MLGECSSALAALAVRPHPRSLFTCPGFNSAYKIHDTPFPFPYVQLITLSLLILTLTCPFVFNYFIESLFFAMFFAFMSVGCYFAINEASRYPFPRPLARAHTTSGRWRWSSRTHLGTTRTTYP